MSHLEHKLEEKEQKLVYHQGSTAKTKVSTCNILIEELFNPSQEENIETNNHMNWVAKLTVHRFMKELRYSKKQTFIHLSSTDGI